MVFNSAVFIVFFAIVYAVYWTLQRSNKRLLLQNRFLLLASYFFYGYWDWLFLSLILITTVVDFNVGVWLDRLEAPRRRKQLLSLSVLLNLGLLGAFKYYDFFAQSFVAAVRAVSPGAFADPSSSILLHVILPVGISFYTFQSMSYTIDVYRGTVKAEKNFLDFALFVSFFPMLVAGPIMRAGELLPQLVKERKFSWDDMRDGAWLILLGFFMKVYVADNLEPLVSMVYAPSKAAYDANPSVVSGHGGAQTALASIAFIFQIYGDFAGYSGIALGAAKMLGVDLIVNFNVPQMSQNPAELWRRWHVSLNRWVTDYVYIPLGGSRMGFFLQYRNVFVLFVVMGFWHGANWTFIIWGAYNGLWLIAYLLWSKNVPKISDRFSPRLQAAIRGVKMVGVFLAFAVSGTFFRAYDFHHIVEIWKSLLTGPWDFSNTVHGVYPAGYMAGEIFRKVAVLLVLDYFTYKKGDPFWIFEKPVLVRVLVYTSLFFTVVMLGVFGKDVIYFAF
ncbi:MAG: MBOAT family protein [Spirochaetia bacterium]|nr:MBOAT family protein [Spirochaetia bacterium]